VTHCLYPSIEGTTCDTLLPEHFVLDWRGMSTMEILRPPIAHMPARQTLQESWKNLVDSLPPCPRWSLLFWMILIPAIHISSLLYFRRHNLYPQLTKKRSRSSDLMAIEITSTICVLWLSLIGCIGFFNLFGFTDGTDLYHPNDPNVLFYRHSPLVYDHLVTPMYVYQIWNLFACLIHNEYLDFASLGHHFVTACLAYCGFHPFAHYYALFYFGVAELTTIPLNLLNTFKHLPRLAQAYPTCYRHTRTIFAISFILIRILWWPVVSYGLFFACLDLLQLETVHSVQVVCFFLFSNLFLTSLQFYWGYLIVMNALGRGKKRSEEKVVWGKGEGVGGKVRHRHYTANLH
jgi:hypothetical protein